MSTTTIETVRGMSDTLPVEARVLTHIQALLESPLVRSGYAPIDLPIVEYRDLYLRKMGEELVGKVYEFSFGGRSIALRPEWTASILRAYVTHMQDQPLPIRLRYSGPVFRYQRPQRLTQRQFIQTGCELIGGTAPRADAEIVALACAGLDEAQVASYQIRLAHIGIIREILMQLELAERTQGKLIWSLEKMRSQGVEAVREHLYEHMGTSPIDPALLENLDDDQVSKLLTGLLEHLEVNLSFGTRPPEAIVQRLVRKMRRDDPQPRIDHAINILWQFSQICGPPNEALAQAEALLARSSLQSTNLQELRAILTMLQHYGIAQERIHMDFGMGRGLHYYTGLIFEIYDDNQIQLCGGGRYDELVSVLGGNQSVPAVGFSYGLERVVAASSLSSQTPESPPSAFVVAITEEDYPYALHVAHLLRQQNIITTIDVRGRSLANNLRYASRNGTDYVAIVGDEERANEMVVWKNLSTYQEERLTLDQLSQISQMTTSSML
jgi:histidyl-tRNA synthetase